MQLRLKPRFPLQDTGFVKGDMIYVRPRIPNAAFQTRPSD